MHGEVIGGRQYVISGDGGMPDPAAILPVSWYAALAYHYHGMAHTHTVGSHTHSVGNHTHSISSHSHTIAPHNHDMTFGIYEKIPTSPSVNVYLSNNGYDFDVFLGTYTADEEIEFGTKIKGTGWKMIRFEGNQLMRITAYLVLKSDIKVG